MVIVGGGIIGSAVALELALRGVSSLILDRGIPGAEASSAAAGMLAPQLEATPEDPCLALGIWSRSLYADWIDGLRASSDIDPAYRRGGALRLAASEEALADAEASLAWQRERGLRVERWDEGRLRWAVPDLSTRKRFVGALSFPDEAQVDPRRLMIALAEARTKANIEAIPQANVVGVIVERERVVGVDLGSQRIEAPRVLIAAGAWSAMIRGTGLPATAIRPARGQMIALSTPGRPEGPFLWSDGGYLVPRRDGRILIGATVEHAGFDKSVTAGAIRSLLALALDTLPGLEAAAITETWAGLRPWTPDHLPILGQAETSGLYFATGHFRNGILHAPATAKILADLMTGTKPSLDVSAFSVERFKR